jgi:hypothetical protein
MTAENDLCSCERFCKNCPQSIVWLMGMQNINFFTAAKADQGKQGEKIHDSSKGKSHEGNIFGFQNFNKFRRETCFADEMGWMTHCCHGFDAIQNMNFNSAIASGVQQMKNLHLISLSG